MRKMADNDKTCLFLCLFLKVQERKKALAGPGFPQIKEWVEEDAVMYAKDN